MDKKSIEHLIKQNLGDYLVESLAYGLKDFKGGDFKQGVNFLVNVLFRENIKAIQVPMEVVDQHAFRIEGVF